MSTPEAQYQQKRMMAADAVALIRDGDTVVVPTGVGEPPALLQALSDRRHTLRDVAVSQILPLRKFAYLDPETRANIRHDAYFFGGATRAGGQAGWVDYIPAYFSELPMLLDRGLLPADVVVSMASPMDEHGYFSLSLAPDYTMAAVRRARVILLEVNPNVPFANGDCHVHVSQVSALVERDEPLFEVGLPQIGPVQEAIGKYVADLIDDGATLQIGYGGIPDAVVMQLQHKRDLGLHTEMIGDGILSLIESGAVTNRRKTFMPGKTIATFALGSNKLYRHLHRNPAVEMHLSTSPTTLTLRRAMTICARSTPPCRSICSASAAPRVSAICPIRAPAARWISCVRQTARRTARPSSCCHRRRRTTPCRASRRCCRRAPTSPPARTTSITSSPSSASPSSGARPRSSVPRR